MYTYFYIIEKYDVYKYNTMYFIDNLKIKININIWNKINLKTTILYYFRTIFLTQQIFF